MTIEWWQLLILAVSCTFSGWVGARTLGTRWVAQKPVPAEKFSIYNILAGDEAECPHCAALSRVVSFDPINFKCGKCTKPFEVLGFDEWRQHLITRRVDNVQQTG